MLQLNSAQSRSYLNATRANDPTGHADDASKSFPTPSITLESTAFIWAGMATRDCYLATSVDQLVALLFAKYAGEVVMAAAKDKA